MTDLLQSAELFDLSSRLGTASSALRSLAQRGSISEHAQKELEWTGRFLSQVDWEQEHKSTGGSGSLAVQVTTVRPTFYASVARLAPRFAEMKMKSLDLVSRFLQDL